MTIELHRETEQRLLESIKRYAAEHLEEEMGDLKASLLLKYVLEEVGPCIYNRAIADAQAYLHDKTGDMDGTLFEPEFGYWRE